ncbi:MAG: endonuclease domain-containing protein [Bacteroidaceae bacterium]|nr:endonuclease domain-containing protein [Bacteroidaceae bacterium]
MDTYNHFAYQNADPAYYSLLKDWAKEMRANPTEAEAILRSCVRANNLGHKFLYQYIIGQFIVDFLCPDCKLIVEVDGGYHSEPIQEIDDEQRTQWLERMGYKVIRFSNEQVICDIDNVLKEIKKYLQ